MKNKNKIFIKNILVLLFIAKIDNIEFYTTI